MELVYLTTIMAVWFASHCITNSNNAHNFALSHQALTKPGYTFIRVTGFSFSVAENSHRLFSPLLADTL